MAMANITVPIQVNLPDDWIEQIVNRLRNDPESEWVEIVRCKDCKRWNTVFDREVAEYGVCQIWSQLVTTKRDFFCSMGERKDDC